MDIGELNDNVFGGLRNTNFYCMRPTVVVFCCVNGEILDPFMDGIDVVRNDEVIFNDIYCCFDPGAPMDTGG